MSTTTTQKSEFTIRGMREDDVPRLVEILKQNDSKLTANDLRRFIAAYPNNGWVAIDAGLIVGFLQYSHDRGHNAICIDSLVLATDGPDAGLVYGNLLILELIDLLPKARRNCLDVILAETDLGLQVFYRELRFLHRKTFSGYFQTPAGDHDGYLMRYRVDQQETPQGAACRFLAQRSKDKRSSGTSSSRRGMMRD